MRRSAWIPFVLVLIQWIVATAASAQPATMHRCSDCDERERTELAISRGNGYRYVFDLTRESISYFLVSGVGAGQAAASRLSVSAGMTTATKRMVAANARFPGLFDQQSRMRVPVGAIGPFVAESPPRDFDPVGVALGYPGPGSGACCAMAEYTSFMNRVRDAVDIDPAAFGDAFAAFRRVMDELAGAGISSQRVEWAPMGPTFQFSLCDSSSDCADVVVDPNGNVEFAGSHDGAGNQYPRMNNVSAKSIVWTFSGAASAERFAAGLRRRGISLAAGTTYHEVVVVCTYEGGRLGGCGMEPI